MSTPYVCRYCGLTTHPYAYHEDAEMCQAAMREFTTRLRQLLPIFQPFVSCWEIYPFDVIDGQCAYSPSGDEIYKEISFRVGYDPEFEDTQICLAAPMMKKLIVEYASNVLPNFSNESVPISTQLEKMDVI